MEKTIEIPFGAKDSELKGWEYTIPEDMEAEIKDGKIIVKQKESEDERIRKSIVETIKQCPDTFLNPKNRDRMLAYLERQKEQKPVQDREEREYVRTLKSLIADFLRDKEDVNRGYYQDIYNWLDGRHIEQPEKDKDAIEVTPKQDYSGLTDFERAIHRGFLCAGMENVPVDIIKDTAQDCLAHIKPAEWSEEDRKMLKAIIDDIHCGTNFNAEVMHEANKREKWLRERLKSLRPSWKPSEEDFAELTCIRDSMPDNEWGNQTEGVLDELIDNLKKL